MQNIKLRTIQTLVTFSLSIRKQSNGKIALQNTIKKYKPYAFFGRGFSRQNLFKMHQIT